MIYNFYKNDKFVVGVMQIKRACLGICQNIKRWILFNVDSSEGKMKTKMPLSFWVTVGIVYTLIILMFAVGWYFGSMYA